MTRLLFYLNLFGQLIRFLIRLEEHEQHTDDQEDRNDQTDDIQISGERAADLVDAQSYHIAVS